MDTLASSIAEDFTQACAAFEQGRLKEAADTFARIVAAEPAHAESVRHLGLIAHRIGNHGQSAELIAQSILLNPASAMAFADLAAVLRTLGQHQSARKAQHTAMAMGYRATDGCAEALAPSALADCWRQVHLVLVEPDNYPHTAGLTDFMIGLSHAFAELGCDAEVVRNRFSRQWMNLVFGAHLIGSPEIAAGVPPNSVLVNLEQLRGSRFETQPIYLDLLTRFPVWDYSPRNIAELKALTGNPRVAHMGIGYVPAMRQLPAVAAQSTDILFYGSLNDRRRAILEALQQAGLRVNYLFSVYGTERDRAIADAKVVLNMHFFHSGIYELIRSSYLLANGKAVVGECNADTEIDDDIRGAMVAVPYGELVAACIALVRDDARRREVEQRGAAIFAERRQSAMLADVIAATPL